MLYKLLKKSQYFVGSALFLFKIPMYIDQFFYDYILELESPQTIVLIIQFEFASVRSRKYWIWVR